MPSQSKTKISTVAWGGKAHASQELPAGDNKYNLHATTFSTNTTMTTLLSQADTRKYLAIYWAYAFLNVAMDEILSLFLLSKTASFGLTEVEIGNLLSAS